MSDDSIKPDGLDGVQHTVRSAVTRLKRWLDPPLDADARPLEIREGILDRLETRVEPAGGGRRILPHNHVSVTVLATSRDARENLQVVLAGLEAAARARLAETRCTVPFGFTVDVHYVSKPRAGWEPHQQFALDLQTRAVTQHPVATAAALPRLRITVTRGQATEPSYTFAESPVLIGRTAAPVDHRGRPRHNHVIFLDEGDAETVTVGRAHASIRFEPDRLQYRLFDDGSHNGTRIRRQGEIIDVPPRNPVGVALLSGDEIQVGSAALVVDIAPLK